MNRGETSIGPGKVPGAKLNLDLFSAEISETALTVIHAQT